MTADFETAATDAVQIFEGCVNQVRTTGTKCECVLNSGSPLLLPRFLGSQIRTGDRLRMSLPANGVNATEEIHVCPSKPGRFEILQVPIGLVTRPRRNKRGELFGSARVTGQHLGIRSIYLPSEAVRNYFYASDRNGVWNCQPALYQSLGISRNGSPGELRLGFELRCLELQAKSQSRAQAERAFNLLARPELRECYDALLLDPAGPALFPYSGFGVLLVRGHLSKDETVFFGAEILSFIPDKKARNVKLPFRMFTFYENRAVYENAGGKIEAAFDRSILRLPWDPTWNQWKHLSGAHIQLGAEFVQSGKYKLRDGEWRLVRRDLALPSRMRISIPENARKQIDEARRRFHALGQFAVQIEQIRAQLEDQPMEATRLGHYCRTLGFPRDFDPSEICWQPDYDPFYYRELSRRARRLFLFRTEYIFETSAGVVVEIPRRGHATYLFARTASLEQFVKLYARSTKEQIRKNQDGVAEKLGFVARIVHGRDPQKWEAEIRARLGEFTSQDQPMG